MTTNTYPIEYGVPILKKPRGVKPNYPFDKMAVGGSFVVERQIGESIESAAKRFASVRTCAYQWGERNGAIFRTDATEERIRVHRVR